MRLLFLLAAATAMAAPGMKWSNLPLSFEPDTGQPAANVRYLARGSAYTLYLASGEIVLAQRNQPRLRTKLAGANPSARIAGEGRQTSTSNYFVGRDPSHWRTAVPNYARVRYANLYPGIDLVYYGKDGTLEYDWILSPGADPQNIRMVFESANRVRIGKQGDLFVKVGTYEYRHSKPAVYQEVAGKRVQVAGSWTLRGKEGSFRVGPYDHARPLIIDPTLLYSTYQGGTGLDYAYAIAVDQAGNSYITGGSGSTDFPTASPLQSARDGQNDVFITKINANGTGRIYSTYLGGGGVDEGHGIAVDSAGNVYVTGIAGSLDFPTKNAMGTGGGSVDAFVTKLNAAGSALVYSTLLGGTGQDFGNAIAVDPAGNAYVVGVTFSTNFPTVNPFQAAKGTVQDAFVAKIKADGSGWFYVTYLGGNNVDEGYAIAADAAGNAFVTGETSSTNFPLASPMRTSNVNTMDAFVTKINPAGSALVFSTYLGGTAADSGNAIAVDSSGVYVAGAAVSIDFPSVNAFQPKLGGPGVNDAFVAKLNPAGSALIYSTYLGGTSEEEANALAVDQAGNAWVTGRTNSSDFPLVNSIQATRSAFDVFVTEISPAGSAALFSTYIGGSGTEAGRGLAVDSVGNVHIAGDTTSTNFPVKNAIQSLNGGGPVAQDAFVLVLGDNQPPPAPAPLAISKSHLGHNFVRSGKGAYVVTVSNPAGSSPTSGTVTVTETPPSAETITAMSGAGWTCSLAGLSCTRTDALASGSSYPPITVLTLLSANAPASVTNQVSVSGGGRAGASASDATVVLHGPFPFLPIRRR